MLPLFRNETKADELQGILAGFGSSVVKGPLRRVTISRSNVWRSAEQFWKLPTVQCRTGEILVKFQNDDVVEPSADLGGPRREFFRLLLEEIRLKSGCFSTGQWKV